MVASPLATARDIARQFNGRLFLSVLLVAFSSFNYGFDNQAFATTQSMTTFQKKFGSYRASTHTYYLPTVWLSLFNSLNFITFGAGVLVGSFISKRFGRRWCMFCMSLYALVSATVSVTSNNKSQIMAARILNYFYIGMELSVVPVFQSEIVPAKIRGLIVGTYQLSLGLGGLVINSTCYGTYRAYAHDDRSWRIPLGLFYVTPAVVASCIWLVPESPRWLLLQNRVEDARHSHKLLRQGASAYSDEGTIAREFSELQIRLEQEQEQGRFIEMFQGTNLKRTLIVVGMNIFQQATGQGFASQYGAIYVKSLKTINPTLFGLMNGAINFGVMIVTLIASDRVGRRTNLFISAFIMLGALLTMGGLGTQDTLSTASKRGIMAMMSVFGIGFVVGWAPLTYVVSTEVPALRLRDQTTRLGFLFNVLFNFGVNFSIPYLVFEDYANLGSKVGFIFGSIVFLSIVFTYFCVPECKGKTLEQIDYLFNAGTPLRDFGKAPAAPDDLPLSEEDVEKAPSRVVSEKV